MRSDGGLLSIDRQWAFCKAAIKPNQIMFCWRSDATRKCSVCALMAMLEIYGAQLPVWLRCRRPLLIHLQCTPSDYDQNSMCWQQSCKCMRHSDAIIDVWRPKDSILFSKMMTKWFWYWLLSLIFFFNNMISFRNWPRYGLHWSGWYCNPAQHELCLQAVTRPRRPAWVLCRIAVPTTTGQAV